VKIRPKLVLIAALAFPCLHADELETNIKTFVDVLGILREQSAEPIDSTKAFYEGAIPGMLRKLDPHSVFFDPNQFEQLKEMEKSTRKGFGTVVSLLPGRVIILQTMPGSPSAKAGLSPGDEIVAINQYLLSRFEVEQLIQLLGQARQNRVTLFVRRIGAPRLLDFTLDPADVDSPSVDRVFLLKPGIGYVRASSFDVPTGKEVRSAIEKLGGKSLKGLVLDLRNNPGGVLGSALETASLFLKPGQRIISAKGRGLEKTEEIDVPKEAPPPYEFPVVVLMNAKSASGSEVVAGALQDHGRAKVIGEPSFGKGLVQSVYPLSNGTGLALTTAFYYTPKGRSIQKPLQGQLEATTRSGVGGIQPDEIAYTTTPSRLKAFLDATGAIAGFATEYLRTHKVDEKFEVTNTVLDEFQLILSQNNVRPGIAEWSADREWIRARLKQEIFNQGLGVAKGDEVEATIDGQIQAALFALEH
jgi:carboxyl-terminal processing protease